MNQYTHEKNQRYLQLRTQYIKEALEKGAEAIVLYAKTNHPYTDRSHFLTDSISHDEVQQSGNSCSVRVGAEAKYAEAVEYQTSHSKAFPFMKPALEQKKAILQKLVDDAELRALRDAGLN